MVLHFLCHSFLTLHQHMSVTFPSYSNTQTFSHQKVCFSHPIPLSCSIFTKKKIFHLNFIGEWIRFLIEFVQLLFGFLFFDFSKVLWSFDDISIHFIPFLIWSISLRNREYVGPCLPLWKGTPGKFDWPAVGSPWNHTAPVRWRNVWRHKWPRWTIVAWRPHDDWHGGRSPGHSYPWRAESALLDGHYWPLHSPGWSPSTDDAAEEWALCRTNFLRRFPVRKTRNCKAIEMPWGTESRQRVHYPAEKNTRKFKNELRREKDYAWLNHQSINQSINHPSLINPSINQTINQSILQSMNCIEWWKTVNQSINRSRSQ